MPLGLDRITTANQVPPTGDGEPVVHAVGVRSDAPDAAELDGLLLAAQGFEGKAGQTQMDVGLDGQLTLAVGLGAGHDIDLQALRRAGAVTSRAARRGERLAVDLLGCVPDGIAPAAAAQALAEGLLLGTYRFDRYRSSTPAGAGRLEEIVVVGKGGKRLDAAVSRGATVARAVAVARDLVNEPGGHLTAPAFAERAVEVGEAAGLEVTVLDEKAIRKQGMGGLLGVNRGSEQPPRFVEVRWAPAKPRGRVALVGKGVTFDSGGLSIKTAEGMATMKDDMGGAAAILGALSAVPEVAPRVAVTAYLPLTDNMIGPDATRVGDVLTIRGGTTVEVLNTDAEGRLILADALVKASEDRPDAIVDVATLTGACMVALGDRMAGLMGNHDGLAAMIRAASADSGEDVWPLPVPAYLGKQLESDIADLRNIGKGRYFGASVAAAFLSRFVADGIPWAHLDIAGPAWSGEDDPLTGKGGTGFGVRLLLSLLAGWRRPA